MSDIFISYASGDRDRAKLLADTFTAQGWSVWWDRIVPPGRQFDEVIEEALDSAFCVVVLWSSASIASNWVKSESAEALRRKVLVPVLIEAVNIPLEFRRVQAADLREWRGGQASSEMDGLFSSIARLIPSPPMSGASATASPFAESSTMQTAIFKKGVAPEIPAEPRSLAGSSTPDAKLQHLEEANDDTEAVGSGAGSLAKNYTAAGPIDLPRSSAMESGSASTSDPSE